MADAHQHPRPRQRLHGRRLVFIAMLFASFALSLGSFWQTMNGMAGFTGHDTSTGWVISFIITTGVQLLLFAISWRIAETWREGGGQLFGNLVIWSICGFVSMFFSFYGFFNDQGGRDEERNLLTVQTEASGVLAQVSTSQDTARNELRENIIAEDGKHRQAYVAWKDDELLRIIAVAAAVQGEIQDGAEARQRKLRADKAQQSDLEISTQRDLDNRQIEIDRLEQQRIARQESIDNLRRELTGAETKITTAQLEADAVRVNLENEGKTGKGPRYRELEVDLNTALGRVESETSKRDALAEQLRVAIAQKEEEAKGGVIDTIKGQQVAQEAELEAIKAEIAKITAAQEEQQRGLELSPDLKREEADNLIAAFEGGALDQYGTMVANCQALLRTLNANDVTEQVKGIDCTSPEIRAAIGKVDEIEAQVANFNSSCRREQLFQLKQVAEIIETAIQCIGTLQGAAASNVQSYSETLANLKATRGEKANLISQARVALFEDLQANAFMAVVLAFSVDILVLLCAWVGRNVGLSEWTRTLDRFIMLTKQSQQPEVFEYVADSPKSGREREQFMEVVGWLLREGLAEWNDSSQQRINLRPGAMQRIRQARAAEMSEDGPADAAPQRTVQMVVEPVAPNVLDYSARFGSRTR